MEIYLDTANLEEIEHVMQLPMLDGVTTNPSILSKQNLQPKAIMKEINQRVDGKVWYQLTKDKSEEMVNEALEIVELLDHPVIKLPMGIEALKACSVLTKQGIETNMTLVFSVSQAILAAKAGATYVSPYIGRMNDIGLEGLQFIEDTVNVFKAQEMSTKVIGASIRSNHDVVAIASRGAKAATMSLKVFKQMLEHPMTDKGLVQFSEDWNVYQNRL
ncbi:transaldolase family protein [Halalkalibacter okhensis]|uniref:Transaldolase n=1 Tax=Halalkalibacter okhensis TaxID=333138 RepID=A0A0B0IPR5_9BACI|nr:transaldolase family protein [Halalkalibacter okhensis]KHF41671.1 hypothetical protein LQ50_02935 [Halalkalibacter okhensis]